MKPTNRTLLKLSRTNLRRPSLVTRCPLAAAASITDDYNVSELARLIGKSEKTLAAKLTNDTDTHHLNLAEAIAVTELTGDERILSAWAQSRGKVLFATPTRAITDDEFADVLLLAQEQTGQLATSIRKARADGVITEADYADINKMTIAAIEKLLHLDAELKAQVREWGSESDE
ncbi:MAG TPA: hypothetical protein DF774_02310 [Rheinheimera sp.]|uniref:phage regulatory CII family protein n=1 Tax=Rheinheimera sp. TaxID=1869214 RepID=UPI000ECA6F52|nr:phage regulatory CII family protein [Rheinheimera sp.]HCU64574.1 hypothetical protein [Rheinheimera sp.]